MPCLLLSSASTAAATLAHVDIPASWTNDHAAVAGLPRSPSSPNLTTGTTSKRDYGYDPLGDWQAGLNIPSISSSSSSSSLSPIPASYNDLNTRLRTVRPAFRQRSLSDSSDATIVPRKIRSNTTLPPTRNRGFSGTRRFFSSGGGGHTPPPGGRVQDDSEEDEEQSILSPRALQILLVTLQLLSLVPAISGVLYCLSRIVFEGEGRRVEWLLSAMWSGLSGGYCHSMARGLTRRWLVYYPLPAAVIRLVSLQVIIWPLTKFTIVNFFGAEELSLPAWMVCAITAAISNTIQIWVTSNLRFLLVSGASSHPASWASTLQYPSEQRSSTPPNTSPSRHPVQQQPSATGGYVLPRGLRSKQVIRQTVLPIASCAFVTLLWAMMEVYSKRGSKVLIMQSGSLTGSASN